MEIQPQESNMCIVSQKDAEQYRADLKLFEERRKEDKDDFQYTADKTFFVISSHFIQKWSDFCLYHDPKRPILPTINQDIVNASQQLLRGLQQKQHYEVVSKRVWMVFNRYKKIEIKRRAIFIGHEKRVIVNTQIYQYCFIRNHTLKLIDSDRYRFSDLILQKAHFSEMGTVMELLEFIGQDCVKINQEVRAWRVTQSKEVFYNYLKKAAQKADYNYYIKGFGKKIPAEAKLCDLEMSEQHFLVLQIKQNYGKWFLQSENDQKCDGCYQYLELKVKCECQKVKYCTEKCKNKDKYFHKGTCQFAQMEELNKPIDMNMSPYSKRGLVGLRNLGNTCFMNSCLQCLSHTRPLTQYFLKGRFQPQINKKNPLGQKGKLAKAYGNFIKAMWCGQQSVVTPDHVKSAVSSIAPMFAGYGQHDSQQFFSFLVDGLHEDLNRIEIKPYVESIECNDDFKGAQLSWMNHIKRNQSIIVDTMTGQYKSLVVCPDCKKKSITYDPFITVTLPLPQKYSQSVDTIIVFPNMDQKAKRIKIRYKKLNAEYFIKYVADSLELPIQRIRIYVVTLYECIYLVGRDSLKTIMYKVEEERKRLYTFILTPQELKYKQLIELPTVFCKKGYYADQNDNLWVKFPLFLDLSTATGKSISIKILTFLYSEVYDNSKKRATFLGGDSLQTYLAKMTQSIPFTLILKYARKITTFGSRLQTNFNQKIVIQNGDSLSIIFQKIQQQADKCELNVLFKDLNQFSFERIKNIDDAPKQKYHIESNEATFSLQDCFATLREQQQLEEGNEWYCSNCKKHKKAFKIMSVHKAPSILIIHLKRFKQKGSYRKQKNQSKVSFPHKLNMNSFLQDPRNMNNYQQKAKQLGVLVQPKYSSDEPMTDKNNNNAIYELFAVSNHFGGLGGGHYTAYAKNNSRWYEFNDSSVHQMSQGQVCTSSAYMLFYQRM